MVAGLCLVLSDTGSWLEIAAGIFLCGEALRTFAVYQHGGHLRCVPRLSLVGGFRIAYTLYLGAGALAVVAAFTSLELPGALIFGYFVVVWMWMIGWALWQWGRGSQPKPDSRTADKSPVN